MVANLATLTVEPWRANISLLLRHPFSLKDQLIKQRSEVENMPQEHVWATQTSQEITTTELRQRCQESNCR